VVANDASDLPHLFSTASGERREIPGALAGELCVAWASGSDAIFLWNKTIPARVERLELATGRRQLAFEWRPSGAADGLYGLLTVTTDARFFAMRFRRGVSSVAVVRFEP
jgi:hypothetical protein